MSIAKRRPPAWGLWIGAGATLVACLLWWGGSMRPIARYGWDLHFRHVGSVPADPSIVMIDINDHALKWVGAWPWPRRRHAALIDVLTELDARAIVLDIAFTEHKPRRVDRHDLARFAEFDPRTDDLDGDDAAPAYDGAVIDDDAELAAAIARAGNVYVAMLFGLAPPDVDPEAIVDRAVDILLDSPGISDAELSARFPFHERSLIASAAPTARIAARLESDFGLGVDQLARRASSDAEWRIGSEELESRWVDAKRIVARRKARRFLEGLPSDDSIDLPRVWPAFLRSVMPDVSADQFGADRSELLQALLAEFAARTALKDAPPVGEAMRGAIRSGVHMRAPIHEIAGAARGVGLVTYEREAVEGVVRKAPLVADVDGRIVGALGYLAALELLGADLHAVRLEGRALVAEGAGTVRRAPVDAGGLTTINWHVPDGAADWRHCFVHIPASRLMEIAALRDAVEDNHRRRRIEQAALVEARFEATPGEFATYASLMRERARLAAALRTARSSEEAQRIEDRMSGIEQQLDAAAAEALEWLTYQWRLRKGAAPRDEEESRRKDRIAALAAKWIEGDFDAEIARLIDERHRRRTARMDALRDELSGKLCFVGYTATAVADFVPSPVHSSMPGVMGHANVANMVLQDRFIAPAPAWLNLSIIAASGLTITLLTRMRGPGFGVGALFGVNGALIALSAWAFRTAGVQTDWLVACVGVCAAWAAVTAYRQFVEERWRRRFRGALAQYTSPAVAEQIARTTDVARRGYGVLAPQPIRVTCFFSDLEGFTPLSERLGAERTRDLLNVYFERMSDALQREGAIVNKFIGDGVFAFFNAPILACARHAEAACAGALAARRSVDPLSVPGSGGNDGAPLRMRIGLATGEAFVGDYGSAAKLDYTCIGDTVNVGARLESANKMFGSGILVDAATREAAGARFVFRSLGRVELPGKATAVAIHELLAERKDCDPAIRHAIEPFEQAIACFAARRWEDATRHWRQCLQRNPDDRVVRWFLRTVEGHRSMPLSDDWRGTITIPERYPPTC